VGYGLLEQLLCHGAERGKRAAMCLVCETTIYESDKLNKYDWEHHSNLHTCLPFAKAI